MQVKDEIQFSIAQGMDQDSFPTEVEKGSWFSALNVLFYSGLQGKNRIASNAIGNTLIPNLALSNLNWKCVAETVDKETNYTYFILSEPTSSTFQIWRLGVDDVFQLVLSNININILGTQKFPGISTVNGNLYWSEGVFESWEFLANGQPGYANPKHLIIEKAIRYTVSGGTDPLGYPDIDFQTLSALKFPPEYSPSFEYRTDLDFLQNFHWRKTYQFMYRYVYDDNSKSFFSSFSELAASLDNEFMNGKNAFTVATNNVIDISINTGHWTVTDIEIAYRNGNTGNWIIFRKINKAELGLEDFKNFVVEFRGNESPETVPDVDLFNYDMLPDVAGTQQFTSANTIVYGDVQEGYDNPEELNITAEWVHTKLPPVAFSHGYISRINAPAGTFIGMNGPGDVFDGYFVGMQLFRTEIVTLPVGSVIVFNTTLINNCTDPVTFSGGPTSFYYYTIKDNDFVGATDILKLNNMLSNMAADLILRYSIDCVSFQINTGLTIVRGIGFKCKGVSEYPNISVLALKEKTFKQGCFHEYSIVYKKKGQKDGGVVSDNYRLYLPYGMELLPSGFTIQDFYYTLMKLSINHEPPNWADTWVPALQKRSGMGAQMQRSISSVALIGQRIKIELENYYFNVYQRTYDYTIEVGDSIRIVQYADFVNNVPVWALASKDIQLSVLEYVPNPGGLDAVYVEVFDTTFSITIGSVLEFSKTKPTSETYPYYEVGQEYPILDAHTDTRRHGGGPINTGIVRNGGAIGMDNFTTDAFAVDYTPFIGRTISFVNTDGDLETLVVVSVTPDFDPLFVIVEVSANFTYNFSLVAGGTYTINGDQTATLPAETTLNGIDVYLRTKTMGIGTTTVPYGNYVVEDDNISNYYPSQDYDQGRVHLYNPEQRLLQRPNVVRGSLAYVKDTKINQLNRFLSTEIAFGPIDCGKINFMYMRGETLRVGMEKKVFSIPINRNTAYLPSGGSEYLFSDAALGPQDAGGPVQGAFRIDTSIQVGSDIYYLDVFNKQVMKDTLGGSVSVNGKMNQFWVSFFKDFAVFANFIYVRMGYSESTKELFISAFVNGTKPGVQWNFTIGLHTLTDKWTSFYSFIPQAYLHGNERLYSIRGGNGNVYEHNTGTPNNFYGVNYISELQFITNAMSQQDKTLLSLFLATNNKPYTVEAFADPTNLQPSGIYTMIPMTERNDGFWGDANMNGNTPGLSDNIFVAMAEGWPCQNPWFKIVITTDRGAQFALRYVNSYFNIIEEVK